ncbi:MAG: DUF2892 domain-containing protein [Saprospiraceae bacterium]|nr:DUF2892 domain-containing protein [Saprospiraceae bacterium]
MKQNMSSLDRNVRWVAAVIMAVLYFTGTVSGTLGLVLLVAAIIFGLTGLVKFCPLYSIFGISTCSVK